MKLKLLALFLGMVTLAAWGMTSSLQSVTAQIGPTPTATLRPPTQLVDTDGDGLPDDWENNGVDGLMLKGPAVDGDANPSRKDVFVYVSWMQGFEPDWPALEKVKKPFSDNQITLHIIKGKVVPHTPMISDQQANTFLRMLASDPANLTPAQSKVFHYAVFGDKYGNCDQGFSPSQPASELFVAIGACGRNARMTPNLQTMVFMHELGHNLGLCHGGPGKSIGKDQCGSDKYKPNYVSVMGSSYLPGILRNGSLTPDYSRVDIDLDEKNLPKDGLGAGSTLSGVEIIWYCAKVFAADGYEIMRGPANGPLNWCNALPFGPARSDVNKNGTPDEVLQGGSDWSNLRFTCSDKTKCRHGVLNASLDVIHDAEGAHPLDELWDVYRFLLDPAGASSAAAAVQPNVPVIPQIFQNPSAQAIVQAGNRATPTPRVGVPSAVTSPNLSPQSFRPPNTGDAGLIMSHRD